MLTGSGESGGQWGNRIHARKREQAAHSYPHGELQTSQM